MLPVISVENLSTHHPIGPRERYKAFRDVITDALTSPFRRLREHSQFAMSLRLPSGRLTFHSSRFPILGARPQFAIRNSQFAMSLRLPSGRLTFHSSRFPILGTLRPVLRLPASPSLRAPVSPSRLAALGTRHCLQIRHSTFAIRNRSCQRPALRRTLNVTRWHVEGCREQ